MNKVTHLFQSNHRLYHALHYRAATTSVESIQSHRYILSTQKCRNHYVSTLVTVKQQQQQQLWIDHLPMNRFTQVRCRSINPYDDDSVDDNDDVIEEASETKEDHVVNITTLQSKLDDDTDSDIDDDDIDASSDEDEDDDDDDDNDDETEKSGVEHPTRNIKRFEIPEGPPPGPLRHHKTKKEFFFQFDYRNVPFPENMNANLQSLLKKIQLTLKDTELEPYQNRRGCETLRKNIENLPIGTKFRVGGDKKTLRKLGVGYDQAVNVTTHRALRKSMFYLLWERHAIMTSGVTHDWKKISSNLIGKSLLGPDTRIVVDQRLGKEIIQELWIRGISSKYNRLIKRHIERSGENHYLQYLQPPPKNPTKKEIALMDWNTDLDLKSNEKIRKP